MAAAEISGGRLVVLSAPSGAGKTTLVHALLTREPRLKFSISSTTRPKRPSEIDGRDYFFVSEERFREMQEQEAFLESALVFDYWYGTGRAHVKDLLDAGYSVLLEIDWQGARQVREREPRALSVFVLPPSRAELERRLRGRGSDSEATIQRRLADAVSDMSHWQEFDYAVINDDVGNAAAALLGIIEGRNTANLTSAPEIRAHAARILAGNER